MDDLNIENCRDAEDGASCSTAGGNPGVCRPLDCGPGMEVTVRGRPTRVYTQCLTCVPVENDPVDFEYGGVLFLVIVVAFGIGLFVMMADKKG